MHPLTFDHLDVTDEQIERMGRVRVAFKSLADVLLAEVPDGADRTYLLRKLRECAMWANVSITRHPDGSPRF